MHGDVAKSCVLSWGRHATLPANPQHHATRYIYPGPNQLPHRLHATLTDHHGSMHSAHGRNSPTIALIAVLQTADNAPCSPADSRHTGRPCYFANMPPCSAPDNTLEHPCTLAAS